MSDSNSPEDRSMSEILASIRRIVSDEEKARREADTTRRDHEKGSGESVLTLTPDMRRGETLSEALGVPTMKAPEAVGEAPVNNPPSIEAADLEAAPPTPRAHEVPPLVLGASDRVASDQPQEPLTLRRASPRRDAPVTPREEEPVTDAPSLADVDEVSENIAPDDGPLHLDEPDTVQDLSLIHI